MLTKIKKNLGILLLSAAYLFAYIYLKHAGLWIRHRWSGLVLGACWAVILILSSRRQSRAHGLGLAVAIFFSAVGLMGLVIFLRGGDSSVGFMAATFLGFAARELYVYYRTRSVSLPTNA